MFTGLIEATGEITAVAETPGGSRIRLATALAAELAPGESLAIDGVCLTVISVDADGIGADVSPETARVTTLGAVGAGTIVNLERSLRVGARLGGHFVQGHVDGVGTCEQVRQEGESYRMTFVYPSELAAFIVQKGSIAVNGVSLTVAGLPAGETRFDVQVIPYTWNHTNLAALKAGDSVNLECDILGKYVARAFEVAASRE